MTKTTTMEIIVFVIRLGLFTPVMMVVSSFQDFFFEMLMPFGSMIDKVVSFGVVHKPRNPFRRVVMIGTAKLGKPKRRERENKQTERAAVKRK